MTHNILLRTLIIGMISLGLFSSCGVIKKYRTIGRDYEKCIQDKDRLEKQYAKAQDELKENESRLSRFAFELKQFKQENDQLKSDLYYAKADLKELQEQHEALKVSSKTSALGSEKEIRQLLKDLEKNKALQIQREDELKKLNEQLNDKEKNIEKMTARLQEKEKRVNELERILFSKDSVVHALRKSVDAALLGYTGKDLTVYVKNGKVYVSLEESLLFATASWQVNPKGMEAIRKLGKVLKDNPEINIMVEGHTDNVPYTGSGQLKDNWDLSVMRATSVARILLDDSGIQPSRVTTSGRSEYNPVDQANSKEARAKNRRTEIILSPKLDELFRILESH